MTSQVSPEKTFFFTSLSSDVLRLYIKDGSSQCGSSGSPLHLNCETSTYIVFFGDNINSNSDETVECKWHFKHTSANYCKSTWQLSTGTFFTSLLKILQNQTNTTNVTKTYCWVALINGGKVIKLQAESTVDTSVKSAMPLKQMAHLPSIKEEWKHFFLSS